jgi:hypothetical protein
MAPHEFERGFPTMADHSAHGSAPSHGFDTHRATYEAFLKGSVALTLLCLYALVALVVFRFAGYFNVLLGFAGLIVGVITVLIDVKTGGKKWFLSGGALVLFGLVVAMSVA